MNRPLNDLTNKAQSTIRPIIHHQSTIIDPRAPRISLACSVQRISLGRFKNQKRNAQFQPRTLFIDIPILSM